MINVMIADDQELIRESLKIVLDQNADMQVTALAENGRQLMEIMEHQLPDVILMDVRMPELDGVQSTREVKLRYPQVKIIILTTFDDDEYVFNALKYGASGYLLKGVSVPDLTNAIRTVVSGGAMINPGIVTKTERNIAHLVGCGRSNREIAEELSLSEGTVRNGLSSALSKLELRDRTQLAIWAVQTGLAAEDDGQ
jgi:DNA-binding NarL/FixJ family response regulator